MLGTVEDEEYQMEVAGGFPVSLGPIWRLVFMFVLAVYLIRYPRVIYISTFRSERDRLGLIINHSWYKLVGT